MVARLLCGTRMDQERLGVDDAMIANLISEGNLLVEDVSFWSEQGVDDSKRLMI